MSGGALLIKNGRLLDPSQGIDKAADVMVADGKVADIAAPNSLATPAHGTAIAAAGKWILPGLIDLHVHLREPGEEYKEDIASGSRAAVTGGFTSIVAMPNTKPVADNAEVVRFVAERGRAVGLCRVLPAGCVSVGQKSEQLAAYGELKEAGAVALSDDGQPVTSARLMRHALEYAQDFGLPILSHAEDKGLSKGGLMHEGAVSTRLGLRGIPAAAEEVAVARDLLLAKLTGGRLHICHVSTVGSVDMIRRAKARGLRVTAEATPHHFTLTDEAVVGFSANTKMNPPLRSEKDRQAVIAGLADGTIDAIATDHAPHSTIEKDTTFDEAANGIVGLETALPLSLELWRGGAVPLLDLVARLTCGPARVLGLPSGTLAKGAVADITIVDPELAVTLTPEMLASKSKNSPFLGRKLVGGVEATIVGGTVVHRRNAR